MKGCQRRRLNNGAERSRYDLRTDDKTGGDAE